MAIAGHARSIYVQAFVEIAGFSFVRSVSLGTGLLGHMVTLCRV